MSQVIGAGMSLVGHLQWHAEMHQKLGRRALHFWFLRLSGPYEKDQEFSTLVQCMEDVDAVAYAGYEISGEFDMMLRLWLPPDEVGHFGELLEEKIRPTTDRDYAVTNVVRHWVWEPNGSIGIEPCKMEQLDRTTLLDDIKALNRLSESSHKTSRVQAKNAREAKLLEQFMEAAAICTVTGESGIRLVLRLRSDPDISNEGQKRVIEQVAATLDRLRDSGDLLSAERSSKLTLREISLYACSEGTLIALCRIDYLAWHKIREQLITPLGRISGLAQTTTFPALSPTLEVSREKLLVDDVEVRDLFPESDLTQRLVRAVMPERLQRERFKQPEEPPDPSGLPKPPPGSLPVSEFLDREEASNFEAKGSAFAPLEPWLNREVDAPEKAGLEEDKAFFCDTIVRAIVAMLNTEGGIILIGALEVDRYAKDNRERMRLRLEAFPCEGRFRLLGLQDPIYRNERWDGFDRKFNQLLVRMIDGTVGRRVALLPGWHNGEHFALVRVHGPGGSRAPRPFYLVNGDDKEFLIRRGGQSERLTGTEVHEYVGDELNYKDESNPDA